MFQISKVSLFEPLLKKMSLQVVLLDSFAFIIISCSQNFSNRETKVVSLCSLPKTADSHHRTDRELKFYWNWRTKLERVPTTRLMCSTQSSFPTCSLFPLSRALEFLKEIPLLDCFKSCTFKAFCARSHWGSSQSSSTRPWCRCSHECSSIFRYFIFYSFPSFTTLFFR